MVLGELALDGGLRAVGGILPAAVAAAERELGLICPAAGGSEAACRLASRWSWRAPAVVWL